MKAIEEIESYRERFGDNAFGSINSHQGGCDVWIYDDIGSALFELKALSKAGGYHFLDYIRSLHNSFPALRDRIRRLEDTKALQTAATTWQREKIRSLEDNVDELRAEKRATEQCDTTFSKTIERLRIEKGELEEKLSDAEARIEKLELVKQTAVDDAACYLDEARRRRHESHKFASENRELKQKVEQLETNNRRLFDAAMAFSAQISEISGEPVSNYEDVYCGETTAEPQNHCTQCGAVREGGE